MAERPGNAICLEGLYELQKDLPRNQNKTQVSNTDVLTTVRSVVDDQKKSGAGTAAWKEGDKERIAPQDPLPKYAHLRTGITAPASLTGFVNLKEFEKFYCWVDDKYYEVKKWFDKNRLYARHWDLQLQFKH